jgi:hypothetical protein
MYESVPMQDETEKYEAMLGTLLEANKSVYDCSTMNPKNIANGAGKVRHNYCPLHTTYDIFNMPSLKKENKWSKNMVFSLLIILSIYAGKEIIQSMSILNHRNEFHVKSIQSSSQSYLSTR